MNKIIVSAIFLLTAIVLIIIVWPKSKNIPIAPDVEAAINSIGPVQVAIPANINDNYHKITLGSWRELNIECAFPPNWKDGHISRRNLKIKEVVLKKNQ